MERAYIHCIHRSISRNTGILYKLKEFLSEKSLLILYNSLILSHINYCNIVWGNCSTTNINYLLLLQKRAIRNITNSSYLAHIEPLFHRLKTLRIQDIHTLQTGIFMYKYTHDQLPSLFQSIFNINSNIHTYPTRRSTDFHLENPRIILCTEINKTPRTGCLEHFTSKSETIYHSKHNIKHLSKHIYYQPTLNRNHTIAK